MAKAKKGQAKQEKAPKVEPFFRPFSKIAPPKKKDEPAAATKAAPAKKAAPPPPPPRVSDRSDEDTFAIFMSGVRALDGQPKRVPRTAERISPAAGPKAPAVDPDAEARGRLRALVVEGTRFETSDDGGRLEGRRLDTDPRELRRLRRGQFALDAKLDLHGLATADARAALEAFVQKRAAGGDRAVIVVHGKGSHSPGGVGVLRGEISAWLSQGRAARHVRAFTSALDEDGGDGALWVLLAR